MNNYRSCLQINSKSAEFIHHIARSGAIVVLSNPGWHGTMGVIVSSFASIDSATLREYSPEDRSDAGGLALEPLQIMATVRNNCSCQ